MGTVKIPYYWVSPYGIGHWKPGKMARDAGFRNIDCGPDGPTAWAKAKLWNEKWQAYRLNGPSPDRSKMSWEELDDLIVYPPGSIGAGFQAYRKIEGLWLKKAKTTRDEWGRCWKHISAYAECDPNTMTVQILVDLRDAVERAHSADLAYRVIKIWRALWKQLVAMKIARSMDSDPSLSIANSMPKGRSQVWRYDEALKIVEHALEQGNHGLAVLMAIAWDTQLSIGDVRALTLSQRRKDDEGTFFTTNRSKTQRAAIGTLSEWSEGLLNAYLAAMPTIPLTEPFIRTQHKNVPYTKNRASEEFRKIRKQLFGDDKRQMRDFRRTGALEALAGDISLETLSMKMANDLSQNKNLQHTYLPNQVKLVREADKARKIGRKKLAE